MVACQARASNRPMKRLSPTRPTSHDAAAFVRSYPPPVRNRALATRAPVRAALPGIVETVDRPAKIVPI
jgi:hypothetical protein